MLLLIILFLGCSKKQIDLTNRIEEANRKESIIQEILLGRVVHFPWTQIEIALAYDSRLKKYVTHINGFEWTMQYNTNTKFVNLLMTEWIGALSFYRHERDKNGMVMYSYIEYDSNFVQLGVVTNHIEYDFSYEIPFIKHFLNKEFGLDLEVR